MPDDASPAGRPMVGKITTDDDHANLLGYHMTVIRQAEAKVMTAKGPVDEAKAVLSEANEELTKAFNSAKGDLGRDYTRKYLEGLLLDGREKSTVLVRRETMRARDKVILNHPVFGVQPELFPGAETPTAARDEMSWRHEGFLRGQRGDLQELQDGDPPAFHQAIMKGFEEGQELAQARFLRAQQAKTAAETPDAAAPTVNLNADPEPGSPDAEANIEQSVERAKESLGVPAKPARARGRVGERTPAGVH